MKRNVLTQLLFQREITSFIVDLKKFFSEIVNKMLLSGNNETILCAEGDANYALPVFV